MFGIRGLLQECCSAGLAETAELYAGLGLMLGICIGIAVAAFSGKFRSRAKDLEPQAARPVETDETGNSTGTYLVGKPSTRVFEGPFIRNAIRIGEFELHYQPKLSCRENRINGAEALARWTLRSGEVVQPDEFVAAAENSGGIGELTLWAVRRAMEDMAGLGDRDLGGPMFINLSAKLIIDEFICDLLDTLGDQAQHFGFEVTETAVINNPQQALRCLHRLREHGIALAIDDYGAGLSSLSYLKQIPATDLKIDKHFIIGMTKSHNDPLIVRSTIDLCHGLGLEVTAEGVENVMTASLLRVMGCDSIQGFFVARPQPIAGFIEFIDGHGGTELSVPQIRKSADI